MSDEKESPKTGKFFERREKKSDLFFQSLEHIGVLLEYVSETNEAVEPFVANTPLSRTLSGYLKALSVDNGIVKEMDFHEFFDRLTIGKEWYRAADKERAKQFSELRELLESNLEDVRVIRVGRVRIDIYVVGIDVQGRLAGMKTKAIET